ncbi:MAG: cytochrome C [Thermoanaerobacteraceae bacterium]|nr:cytochrome C [Thermoanaerobacteraceae bacterium]
MKKFVFWSIFFLVFSAYLPAAIAEQVNWRDETGRKYFGTTTTKYTYNSKLTPRLIMDNKFTADGTASYPYEIYLPNETNPDRYRIHSNYSKDTDACASCHATHTAVGKSLLQWSSTYDTCLACHDGTVTTTYDVVAGKTPAGKPAPGGMFGTGKENFLSTHKVNGAVTTATAPGGSTIPVQVERNGKSEVIAWGVDFGCQSCHSPHGLGGNARLLHPDPNGAATRKAAPSGYVPTKIDAVTVAVYPSNSTTEMPYRFLNSYPYTITLWDSSGNEIQGSISNKNGYTLITVEDANSVSKVYGTPAITVQMKVYDYLGAGEKITYVRGINEFCGACHTDYDTTKVGKPSRDSNGIYSKAYRHKVGTSWYQEVPGLQFEKGIDNNNIKITCLTCHVAHGTSQEYWKHTLANNTLPEYQIPGWSEMAEADFQEIAGSSALKRMPNMGTCESCHDKSSANKGYLANSGQTKNYNQIAATANGIYTQLTADWADADVSVCGECHKEQYTQLNVNNASHPHVAWNWPNCSHCHGPLENHLKSPSETNIENPEHIANDQFLDNGTCWWCHSYETWTGQPQYTQYKDSKHYLSGVVTCYTCHDMHRLTLRYPKQQLCAICHDRTMNVDAIMSNSGHEFKPLK